MSDIARRLNISRATVSYVLNERPGEIISEATRERVLQTARELGYRPNRAAQVLAGRRSNIVELCIHSFSPAFYSQVLQAFELEIGPTDYQLHTVTARHWTQSDWENVDRGWPTDGIIAFDANLSDEAVASLRRHQVALVATGVYPRTDTDHVSVDLYEATKNAVEHLLGKKRRVAYLTPRPANAADKDPRYPAYRNAMLAAGQPEEVILAIDGSQFGDRPAISNIMRHYIREHGCPEAIFCFNDEFSVAALVALRDQKIRVPEDVLLLGCDGIHETAYHLPALSTIQYPYAAVAQWAWEFLQQRIENPESPLQSAVLAPKLLLRASSGD
jgi:LacI family transcriptional regulator